LDRAKSLSISVACATWQLDALTRWPVLQQLRENPRADFKVVEPYIHWTLQREYYKDARLLTWADKLNSLDLPSFDLVISDNLVEALRYHPGTVLMGSFFWHDIYRTQFPDEPLVLEYWESCEELLRKHKPTIIVNRYFAMPAVRERVRLIDVGMLPPVLRGGRKRATGAPGLLIAGGASSTGAKSIRSFLEEVVSKRIGEGLVRLFVERRIAQELPPNDGWSVFDYDADDFRQINAMIARPGMGAIADCVGTGTPMFCVYETNPEMEHNAKTLERLGLGWSMDLPGACLDEIRAFFENQAAQAMYEQRAAAIDKCGLEQTVQNLAPFLR